MDVIQVEQGLLFAHGRSEQTPGRSSGLFSWTHQETDITHLYDTDFFLKGVPLLTVRRI